MVDKAIQNKGGILLSLVVPNLQFQFSGIGLSGFVGKFSRNRPTFQKRFHPFICQVDGISKPFRVLEKPEGTSFFVPGAVPAGLSALFGFSFSHRFSAYGAGTGGISRRGLDMEIPERAVPVLLKLPHDLMLDGVHIGLPLLDGLLHEIPSCGHVGGLRSGRERVDERSSLLGRHDGLSLHDEIPALQQLVHDGTAGCHSPDGPVLPFLSLVLGFEGRFDVGVGNIPGDPAHVLDQRLRGIPGRRFRLLFCDKDVPNLERMLSGREERVRLLRRVFAFSII